MELLLTKIFSLPENNEKTTFLQSLGFILNLCKKGGLREVSIDLEAFSFL
jgi:hypothetical protein